MATQIKHEQRFVIATDYKLFLAIDTQTQDKLDVDLKDLPKHFDFFLPWAGMWCRLRLSGHTFYTLAGEKADSNPGSQSRKTNGQACSKPRQSLWSHPVLLV